MNDDKHASHRDAKRESLKNRIPKHGRRLGEIYRQSWEKRVKPAPKQD